MQASGPPAWPSYGPGDERPSRLSEREPVSDGLVRRFLAWLKEPYAIIAATLRDPLYRIERRQQGWLRTPLSIVIGLALLPGAWCCLVGVVIYAVLGMLGSEGLICELDRGTLEGVLVTPLGRSRWLWAKLLARMRGLVVFAMMLPVLGAATGLVLGFTARGGEDTVLPPLIGLGLGLLLGVLLLPLCLSCGAVGLVAALMGRTRMKSLLFSYLFAAPFYIVDAMLVGALYVGWVILLVVSLEPHGGETLIPPSLSPWLIIGMAALSVSALAVRAHLYIGVIPRWLLGWTARNMDARLLVDGP